MRTIKLSILLLPLMVISTSSAQTITDGFGDGDRNNDGTISVYDTDVDLNGAIDGTELTGAEDAADVGIYWAQTRGFTSSNTGDPKPNLKIIDDTAGLGSGYALSAEAKGGGSSMAGFFGQSMAVGPNVGDKIVAEFDFRLWAESTNPTPPIFDGQLRWGLFQDTDNQFGMSNAVGLDDGSGQASVVWGADSGENDGEWRGADPGPVGDAGYWARIPIGAGSDSLDARLNYEVNTARFLEGSDADDGGDQETIASPTSTIPEGPGGKIGGDLATDPTNQIPVMPHNLRMEIARTSDSVEVSTYINDVLVVGDELGASDIDALGAGPDSFDYIALRNATGDWDFIIDNFSISAVAVPEPSSLSLLLLAGLGLLSRKRR